MFLLLTFDVYRSHYTVVGLHTENSLVRNFNLKLAEIMQTHHRITVVPRLVLLHVILVVNLDKFAH